MLNTALTQNWGLKHPLILAPMANTAGGELAAAVTRAGGLGLFGIGSTTATAWIAAEAAKVRPAGIWGAGLMTWALETRSDLLEALLAEKPDVVSLSFGDPTPFVERVRAAGAKLVAQVQDRESAVQALDAGHDDGRHVLAHQQHQRHRHDELVGHRIEEGTQPRGLAHAAREITVERVRDAGDGKQQTGRGIRPVVR